MSNVTLDEYLAKRADLSPHRITMLRYLNSVADQFHIDERTKGNSRAVCKFDCGTYKGYEIVEFRISIMEPIGVAWQLMNLTSGHHFWFANANQAALKEMSGDYSAHAQAVS